MSTTHTTTAALASQLSSHIRLRRRGHATRHSHTRQLLRNALQRDRPKIDGTRSRTASATRSPATLPCVPDPRSETSQGSVWSTSQTVRCRTCRRNSTMPPVRRGVFQRGGRPACNLYSLGRASAFLCLPRLSGLGTHALCVHDGTLTNVTGWKEVLAALGVEWKNGCSPNGTATMVEREKVSQYQI